MLQLWPWRVVVHVLGSYSFVPTNIGYELMTYEPLPRSSAIWVLGFERVGATQAGSGREKQNKLNLALEWQMNEVGT